MKFHVTLLLLALGGYTVPIPTDVPDRNGDKPAIAPTPAIPRPLAAKFAPFGQVGQDKGIDPGKGVEDIPVVVGTRTAPWMVELKIKNVPKGAAIIWDVYDSKGTIAPVQRRYIKAEHSCIFAGPIGTYKVLIRLIKDEDVVEIIDTIHLTGGGGPAPTPLPVPPGPTPEPPAPPPAGKFGLSKASRDGATAVIIPNNATSTKATQSKALASSNYSFASSVAAGGTPDPSLSENNAKIVLDSWGVANTKAITESGGTTESWSPWGVSVQKQFFAKVKDGSIKTKADWNAAFVEIADGLEPPK